MNFLAHYHTAHTSITSYELLGLILPDLVHDFSKLYNVHREAIFASENDFLLAIRNGIALHIKGDEIFHKHYTFVENEQFAKSLLLEANTLTVKRKFIIAHVMVELIIDQYIICHFPEKLDAFYTKIIAVEVKKANFLFDKLEIPEKNSHFIKNFNNFIDLKFLFHLKDNEGIVLTLDKVFGKLLQYDFMQEIVIWNQIIEQVKENMNNKLPEMFNDINKKLYE